MDEQEFDNDSLEGWNDDPCENCGFKDACDGWDAMFCCTRCTAGMDEIPDDWCEHCDPWDI